MSDDTARITEAILCLTEAVYRLADGDPGEAKCYADDARQEILRTPGGDEGDRTEDGEPRVGDIMGVIRYGGRAKPHPGHMLIGDDAPSDAAPDVPGEGDVLDQIRRAVAELEGLDPETWPEHGNAALAITSTVAIYRLEVERLEKWVSDLQAGCFINCVYCGHRYGPEDEVPATMADALREHVEQCPKHPMSVLKAENARLRTALAAKEADAPEPVAWRWERWDGQWESTSDEWAADRMVGAGMDLEPLYARPPAVDTAEAEDDEGEWIRSYHRWKAKQGGSGE